MKTTIYIFDKTTNNHLGHMEHENGHFHSIIKDEAQRVDLCNYLESLRPSQIIGVPQNDVIVDTLCYLEPENPHFISRTIYELSERFNQYYFIATEMPIDWRKIEDELSLYLTSGALEENERVALLEKLPALQNEQILLIHDQLKQAYNFFYGDLISDL